MAKIGRLWAGNLYGTNTGKLFAEFDDSDGSITGKIRVLDDVFGLTIYRVAGSFDGSGLKLTGEYTQAPQDVAVGDISVEATLTPEGHLRGTWSSAIGTAGTFALFPHDTVAKSTQDESGLLPERLHSAVRVLGAIRLYADDVRELIGFLARDFRNRRVVVTYYQRGNEVSRYFDDFEKDIERLGELKYLKLGLQEPEAYGLNRVAFVDLNANGRNEVRVQGVQESWVTGKAEALTSELRQYQQTLATTARKFGVNITTFIGLAAVVLLPELTLLRRAIFMAIVVLLNSFITYLHTKYIPNAIIYLSPRKPSTLERAWPQILSWLIAASAALVASIAYGILSGQVRGPWSTWIPGAESLP